MWLCVDEFDFSSCVAKFVTCGIIHTSLEPLILVYFTNVASLSLSYLFHSIFKEYLHFCSSQL